MKTKLIIPALLVFLAFSACTPKTETNENQTCKNQVLADSLNTQAVEAYNSGDVQKVLNLYADDAVFISQDLRIGGKDSLAVVLETVVPYMSNFNPDKGITSVTDDLMYYQGLFTFDWNKDNYSAMGKGFMTTVYKKQADNSWKITLAIENHGDLVK